jgi:hypothetical protein
MYVPEVLRDVMYSKYFEVCMKYVCSVLLIDGVTVAIWFNSLVIHLGCDAKVKIIRSNRINNVSFSIGLIDLSDSLLLHI